MHLVYRALEKDPVPQALPTNLVPPSKRRKAPGMAGAVPVLPGPAPVLPAAPAIPGPPPAGRNSPATAGSPMRKLSVSMQTERTVINIFEIVKSCLLHLNHVFNASQLLPI